jgi:hypothetical protein
MQDFDEDKDNVAHWFKVGIFHQLESPLLKYAI